MGAREQNAIVMKETNGVEQHHAMVPHQVDAIEASPMACDPLTRQPLYIQLHIPLRSPIQVLHDSVTHNATPLEIQEASGDHDKCEEEGDEESIA